MKTTRISNWRLLPTTTTLRDELDRNETDRNIAELQQWLAAHPNPSTHQGKQAKHDREVALARWLRLADTERTVR